MAFDHRPQFGAAVNNWVTKVEKKQGGNNIIAA